MTFRKNDNLGTKKSQGVAQTMYRHLATRGAQPLIGLGLQCAPIPPEIGPQKSRDGKRRFVQVFDW